MEKLELNIRPDVFRLLNTISRFLARTGAPSYLVGGFVRDTLLGRETADIDVTVGADALEITPALASALGGRYIHLDKDNGISRIVIFDSQAPGGRWEIDIATLRHNIDHDLARRDLTIDTLSVPLADITGPHLDLGVIIDPFNGLSDLRHKIVRAVSDTAFEADPVRLIRAVRLAAELCFSIDSRTESLIQRDSRLIAGVASERIREELLRVLSTPEAGRWLSYLGELGILTTLIPELKQAEGVSQPWVHIWDVYEHSIQTVAAISFLLREAKLDYAGEEILDPVPWSDRLSHYFDQEVSHGSNRRSLLKLAALLHDIAKPRTRTIDEDGRARFLGHPREGAVTAKGILERLRFSSKETKLIELMVRYHMRPTQMSHGELPSSRAVYRYLRDTSEAGIDILFLSLADHLATRGRYVEMAQWQGHARIVEYVINKQYEEKSLSLPPKLVDGNDIMKTFDLDPGPRVGELLETVREAQAAGEVMTREQALEYLGHLLTGQGEQ